MLPPDKTSVFATSKVVKLDFDETLNPDDVSDITFDRSIRHEEFAN